MAGEKQVSPGAGLSGVADILKLLGGTQSTTNNTGDASGLYDVQNALKGQDFNAMLQSIFQQAAGQLPGLQSRLSNAVGARTGNNGPVQAALSKVLQSTTLAGQQQIAQQQSQNLATRGSVAANIANATNAQKTTSGLNYGGAAKAIGGLQLASQVGKSDLFKKGKDLFGGLLGNDSGNSAATDTASSLLGGLDIGAAPDITQNMEIPDLSGILDLGMPDLSGFADIAGDVGDAASSASDIDYGLEFADGGLVRRSDGASFNTKRALADAGEADPDTQARYDAMKKANAKQKADKESKAKNDYDKSSNMVDQATGIRFADGGPVSINSAGGRRSSAPSYTPDAILASIAGNGRGVLTPVKTPVQESVDRKDSSQSHDTSSPAAGPGALSFGLKALAGLLTGNPLGLVAAALDSAASTKSQSPVNAFSLATSLATANPIGIITNLAKAAFDRDPASEGYNSIGNATGIDNANGFSGLSAALTGEGAFGLNAPDATAGVGVGIDAALDGPAASTDSGGADGADGTDGFGEGFGDGGFDAGGDGFGGTGGYNGSAGGGWGNGGYGFDGSGDGGGSGDGSGDGGAGGGGGGFAANGGKMRGPGTGTSDSIPIRVSDGEYIISADVVDALGANFFDHLQAQFHLPVNQNSPNWKKSAPADSDGE